MTNWYFSYFPRKQPLTFHANCLPRRQFAWSVKAYFLEKNKKSISICRLLKILPRVLSIKVNICSILCRLGKASYITKGPCNTQSGLQIPQFYCRKYYNLKYWDLQAWVTVLTQIRGGWTKHLMRIYNVSTHPASFRCINRLWNDFQIKGQVWSGITLFDLITSHTTISAQSSNSVVFRLQPV